VTHTRTRVATAVVMAVAVATALVVLASLLHAGPAQSAPAPEGERAAAKVRPDWGKTSAKNGVLKKRCRNYPYTYAITPPEGEWGLETFLIGPKGKPLASGAFVIGQDGLTGKGRFRFCRPITRPGVFKIRAKLSVQEFSGKNYREGWLPVTRFRLRSPR
jgi:hypothetical protein